MNNANDMVFLRGTPNSPVDLHYAFDNFLSEIASPTNSITSDVSKLSSTKRNGNEVNAEADSVTKKAKPSVQASAKSSPKPTGNPTAKLTPKSSPKPTAKTTPKSSPKPTAKPSNHTKEQLQSQNNSMMLESLQKQVQDPALLQQLLGIMAQHGIGVQPTSCFASPTAGHAPSLLGSNASNAIDVSGNGSPSALTLPSLGFDGIPIKQEPKPNEKLPSLKPRSLTNVSQGVASLPQYNTAMNNLYRVDYELLACHMLLLKFKKPQENAEPFLQPAYKRLYEEDDLRAKLEVVSVINIRGPDAKPVKQNKGSKYNAKQIMCYCPDPTKVEKTVTRFVKWYNSQEVQTSFNYPVKAAKKKNYTRNPPRCAQALLLDKDVFGVLKLFYPESNMKEIRALDDETLSMFWNDPEEGRASISEYIDSDDEEEEQVAASDPAEEAEEEEAEEEE
jgi:hypothetical protein